MPNDRRIDALCLTCGTVRTVTYRYIGRFGERRLKCAGCKRTTMHGSAEGKPCRRERDNALATSQSAPYAQIEALGWQVVEVPRLARGVCLVREEAIVLVRAGMNEEDRQWAIDWVVNASPLARLKSLGWRVVEVEGLPDDACVVDSQKVLMVRKGIDAPGRRWAAEFALKQIRDDHAPGA